MLNLPNEHLLLLLLSVSLPAGLVLSHMQGARVWTTMLKLPQQQHPLLLSVALPVELATKSYAGEPVFDLYAEYFGTAAFLDQPVSFAFAGKCCIYIEVCDLIVGFGMWEIMQSYLALLPAWTSPPGLHLQVGDNG
jgi:hypothetical protein